MVYNPFKGIFHIFHESNCGILAHLLKWDAPIFWRVLSGIYEESIDGIVVEHKQKIFMEYDIMESMPLYNP